MEKFSFNIGDEVYFYSSVTDECLLGRIEGYYTDDYKVVKILQELSDGYLRYIVPYTYIGKTKEDIELITVKLRREKFNEEVSKKIYSGCVVLIKDVEGNPIKDKLGNPYRYQVIAVYSKQARAVTDYGEEVGLHDINDLTILDEDPIFKMEDYDIGQRIVWVEYDEVFEGTITNLHSSSAEVSIFIN